MFGWFAKIREREVLKLLFQNNSFLVFYTNYKKDEDLPKIWLVETEKIAKEFYSTRVISRDDLKKLLDINSSIRRLYRQNDPKFKMFDAGLLSKKPPSFDEEYRPISGWKNYYVDNGC